MSIRSIVTIALIVALSGLGSEISVAASAQTLTLAQAQQLAIAQHPNIRELQFDAQAAQEAVKIARSGYAPQVSGSAVSVLNKPDTRIAANVAGITDPTVLQRTAAGVAISQYITDFGRTADLVQSFELAHKAEAERGKETRLSVLLGVTLAYFEVLRANALLQVTYQTLSERRTLYRQISVLQRAGLRSTLDVSIAQRDVSIANQAIIVARGRRRDAMAALSDALGSPLETDYVLDDMRSLPAIPKAIGPLIDEMLANNPELAALNADVASAQKRASSIARETSPTITAYGYLGGSPIRAINQAISASYETAGVAMNVPIFTGGSLAAERRQAQDIALADAASAQAERDALLRETRTAFDDVQSSRSNIDATDQIVSTARTALGLTQTRYRIGLSSIVDLSEAELQLTQAQIDHANAIYDYIEQGAGLDFITGALAPAA
jgi:outer membrane protein